jgi:hypothetical protein
MIPGPQNAAHIIIANCYPSLRFPDSINARAPKDYLAAGSLVCFNKNRKLFHLVKGPAHSDGGGEDFDTWFGQHDDRNCDMFSKGIKPN